MASMSYTGNLRSSPAWLGDFSNREHILPVPARIDPIVASAAGLAVTLTANAAQGATSITVTALSYGPNASTAIISQGNVLIPSGTTLYFGGAKIATTTADAAYGATTIAVAALPTALVSGDTATFNRFGTLFVPSGTFIGRTYTERSAGTAYGVADPAGDDELWLTAFDVNDVRFNADVELVRHGTLVKENYLPGYGGVLGTSASPSASLTKLRTIYRCIVGRD